MAQLVSNMERLDEANKEESEGVHNTMGKRLLLYMLVDSFLKILLAWYWLQNKGAMRLQGFIHSFIHYNTITVRLDNYGWRMWLVLLVKHKSTVVYCVLTC